MKSKTHTQGKFDKINFLLRPQKTTRSSTDAIQQLLDIVQSAQDKNTTAQSMRNAGTEN